MPKRILKLIVKHSECHNRASIYIKDSCERCSGDNRLAVHHINNNPYDNTQDNLMTLCNRCHALWHWENGKVRGKDLKPRKRVGYFLRYGHEPPKIATDT